MSSRKRTSALHLHHHSLGFQQLLGLSRHTAFLAARANSTALAVSFRIWITVSPISSREMCAPQLTSRHAAIFLPTVCFQQLLGLSRHTAFSPNPRRPPSRLLNMGLLSAPCFHILRPRITCVQRQPN